MAWLKKKDWTDNFKKDDPLLIKVNESKEDKLEDKYINNDCKYDTSNPVEIIRSVSPEEKPVELIINDSHFEIDTESETDTITSSVISEEIKNEQLNNRLHTEIMKIIEQHTNYMPFLKYLSSNMVMDVFISSKS
jgi:hypothetical protein